MFIIRKIVNPDKSITRIALFSTVPPLILRNTAETVGQVLQNCTSYFKFSIFISGVIKITVIPNGILIWTKSLEFQMNFRFNGPLELRCLNSSGITYIKAEFQV